MIGFFKSSFASCISFDKKNLYEKMTLKIVRRHTFGAYVTQAERSRFGTRTKNIPENATTPAIFFLLVRKRLLSASVTL